MTHIIENKGEFALRGADESYEKTLIIPIAKKHQRNQRCGSWERCDPFQGAFVLSHAPERAMQMESRSKIERSARDTSCGLRQNRRCGVTSARRPHSKSGKRRRTRSLRKPNSWQTSAAWRQIGSEAIRAFNARKHLLPKCGAHAKTTGEPCRNLALANGRCRVHGGLTGAGDLHGVRRFTPKPPGQQTKRDWPKAQAKLDKFAKQDKVRRVRLALMTPEEFTLYFRRTHARHGIEFRKIVDTELRRRGLSRNDIMPSKGQMPFANIRPAAIDPEVARIQDEITRLRALKAEMEAAQAVGDETAVDELEAATVQPMFGEPPKPDPHSESALAEPGQNGDPPDADSKPGTTLPLIGVFA